MIKCARLTLQLREVIENMHADGYVQEAIAAAVGVDQSTVSRELRRRPGAYAARPCHAQAQSRSRIPTTVPLLDRNGELRRHLVNRMRNKYSIAQSLRLIGAKHPHLPTISPQAVYDWLYAGDTHDRRFIRSLMTRPRTRRQPRAKTDCGSGRIKDMTMIDKRPAGAGDRTELGHWEGDLIIGKGGRTAVATLVERVTRITIHIKVSTRRSADVVAAIAQRMRAWHVISITWDQGKEMSEHHELARRLRIDVYFAEAHSPWQRGSNENSNGVSRRHMPKGTELDRTPAQLRRISQLINDRPMAVLSCQSSKGAYAAQVANMR